MRVLQSIMTGRVLLGCGLLLLIAAATLPSDAIHWIRGCVVAGGLLCAVGAQRSSRLNMRRTDQSLSEQRTTIPAAVQQQSTRDELEKFQQDVNETIQQQFDLLEQRQKALSDQLLQYREWLEYPLPARDQADTRPQANLEQTQADRRVLEILHSESQRVFAAILDKEYLSEGHIDAKRIRDDLLAMANQIAAVYQPDHETPLLSANLEQLLRASSRACLHMLIVIEQLPWNAEQRSLESLYSYISSAVSAYGVYKKAEPYLGFLNKSFYVGRFLAGSNPLTLGTWWLAGHLGKQGGQALARKYAQHQAIAFIHELLRVVGYEVAGIYGGDFRHRDPNWIFGVELTRLVNRKPLTRESLRYALEAVSRLELRNEYDRLYLYRCLAQQQDPGTHLQDVTLLTAEQRASTLERLEDFYRSWYADGEADPDLDWQADLEDRFQMQLNIVADDPSQADSSRELQVSSATSLLSYCQALLGQSQETAWKQLTNTRVWSDLPQAERDRVSDSHLTDCELEFVPPQLHPTHPLVDDYLEDLLEITAQQDVLHTELDELLLNVAAYYRRSATETQQRLDQGLTARFHRRWQSCSGIQDVPADQLRSFLQVRHEMERPMFAYRGVRIDFSSDTSAEAMPASDGLCLWGTNQRLLLLDAATPDRVLWSTGQQAQLEQRRGVFLHDGVIRGGDWQNLPPEWPSPCGLVIPGRIGRAYDETFGDLTGWSPSTNPG